MYITNIYVPKQDYSLVGVGFTFTIFAVVFVLLRLFTRIWLVRGRGLGFDDGFIVLSTFGTLGFLISVVEQIRYGLGEPPNPKLFSPFIQATVASVISYTTCHLCVKLSIAFQCLRIFEVPRARRFFISFIIYISIYGTICLFLTVFTCYPVAKYWDDSIPGKCLDNRALRYAFAGINIFNDITLLIAPMPFLRGLQIAKRAKYVLIGVFAAGAVACIIAIIRVYSLWEYSAVPVTQRPLKGIHIAIWSSLECNIAIICACVPALKGLASLIFPGLMGAKTQSSSLPGSGGSGTNSSRHGWGSRNDRGHNGANFGPEGKVIKMERSFEMRTVAVGDDNDSEKNLVTGPTATYHSHIYTGANERSPVPDTEICVMDKRLGRESL